MVHDRILQPQHLQQGWLSLVRVPMLLVDVDILRVLHQLFHILHGCLQLNKVVGKHFHSNRKIDQWNESLARRPCWLVQCWDRLWHWRPTRALAGDKKKMSFGTAQFSAFSFTMNFKDWNKIGKKWSLWKYFYMKESCLSQRRSNYFGSGSCPKARLRADPPPKHWKNDDSRTQQRTCIYPIQTFRIVSQVLVFCKRTKNDVQVKLDCRTPNDWNTKTGEKREHKK